MEPPPVRFATTSDGKRLAYTVSGRGRPLVLVPNTMMHAHWAWLQFPEWFQGLAERFRFVHFNYRGQGMSTRGLAPDHSIADWQRDLSTVMDAAECRPAILMSVGHGCYIAVRYALEHPDRVAALVLFGATVSMSSWPQSYHQGVAVENWELHLRNVIPRSLTPEHNAIWAEAVRETQTQAEFMIAIREIFQWSLEGELSALNIPTLVIHPRGVISLRAEECQRFAAEVPGARFVSIGGDYALGDATEGLRVIDSFIANLGVSQGLDDTPHSQSLANKALDLAHSLTPREAEVLRLIAGGRSNQQIAEELVLSVRTVERHITNVYAKIGVHGKAGATAYALRNGLT